MSLTTREWIDKNLDRFGSTAEAADACAAELGVCRKTFFNTINRMRKKGFDKRTGTVDSKIASLGLSEKDLRAKHDALYRLEQAVGQLVSGRFISEAEFRSLVGIDPSKFRAKADLPQFDQYKGRVGNLIYWGNPKDIRRLKEESVLQ